LTAPIWTDSLNAFPKRDTCGMFGIAFAPPVRPPMLFCAVRVKISPKARVTIAR